MVTHLPTIQIIHTEKCERVFPLRVPLQSPLYPLQGTQRHPKRHPQGTPKGTPKGTPEGHPKALQGTQEGQAGHPQGTQEGPSVYLGPVRTPVGSSSTPFHTLPHPSGTLPDTPQGTAPQGTYKGHHKGQGRTAHKDSTRHLQGPTRPHKGTTRDLYRAWGRAHWQCHLYRRPIGPESFTFKQQLRWFFACNACQKFYSMSYQVWRDNSERPLASHQPRPTRVDTEPSSNLGR